MRHPERASNAGRVRLERAYSSAAGESYPQPGRKKMRYLPLAERCRQARIARLAKPAGFHHETHLSTFRGSSQAHARFPGSLAYARRSRSAACTACQGPGASGGLNTPTPAARDEAFRRHVRLCKTDDFSSVFAFRRSLRSTHFQLLYRPNGGSSARLGTVIAKRFAKRAVDRNLVKRVGREAFRTSRLRLPACDLVLRLSATPARFERAGLRAEIDGLLTRLTEQVR